MEAALFRRTGGQSFDFTDLIGEGRRGPLTAESLARVTSPLIVSLQSGRVSFDGCQEFVESISSLPTARRAQFSRVLARVLPAAGNEPVARHLLSAFLDMSHRAHLDMAAEAFAAHDRLKARKAIDIALESEVWLTSIDPRAGEIRARLANES